MLGQALSIATKLAKPAGSILTLGGLGYGGYELSQVPKNIREGILSTDYNPETDKYDTNLIQNTLLKLGGYDAGGLVGEKNKRTRNVALKSGFINDMQSADPSLKLMPGMTEQQFKNTYSRDIQRIQALRDKKTNKIINADETEKEQSRYEDRLRREDQLLLSQERARLDNLEYQRSRDRRADMQYNENLARLDRKDRKAAISSATAGLAALAAAFAI